MENLKNMANALPAQGEIAEILISEEIDSETVTDLKAQINLAKQSEAKKIIFIFNSIGGNVLDGLAMYDIISALSEIETEGRVCGVCASAATYALLACDKVTATPNSYLMIHRVAGGIYGENLEEIAKSVQLLEEAEQRVVAIYAAKTGLNPDEVFNLMNKADYLNSSKALELKLIDEITGKTAEEEAKEDEPKELAITNKEEEELPKIFTLKGLINRVKSVIMADSSVETDLQNAAELENSLQVAHNRIKSLENELEALRLKADGNETFLKNELAKVKDERDSIQKTIAENVAKQIANLGLNADECPAPIVKNCVNIDEEIRKDGIRAFYKYF